MERKGYIESTNKAWSGVLYVGFWRMLLGELWVVLCVCQYVIVANECCVCAFICIANVLNEYTTK